MTTTPSNCPPQLPVLYTESCPSSHMILVATLCFLGAVTIATMLEQPIHT